MPGTLGRNLHLCFTTIKRPLEPQSPSVQQAPEDHIHPILIKNYNSLCDYTFESTSKSPTHSSSLSSSEPDFAAVFASQRFFFSSPGRSNSIIESTPSNATSTESSSDTLLNTKDSARPHFDNNTMNINHSNQDHRSLIDSYSNDHHHGNETQGSWNYTPTVEDSVAVSTYSPDPYMDFRRSMQEMVEARGLVDVKANWDFLHELLLCYLGLNPKSTHKFIIGAFADLLVSLLSSPPKHRGRRETDFDAGVCGISREY